MIRAPAPRAPAALEPVMTARRLTKTYHMGTVEVPALRSVDLDLYPGEMVIILGASGAGSRHSPIAVRSGVVAPYCICTTFLEPAYGA